LADDEGPPVGPVLTGEEFRLLYPGLRRFAAVVGDADVDPDDLVQEALAGYLRRFEGTDGADQPVAYLRTMIRGLASNHRRNAGRRRRASIEAPSAHVDAYPSDVRGLLALASPDDRALLLLVDVEGEAIGTVAAALGISTVAARARLSRVRRRLRTEIGDDHEH
jgi:RNA polymerase sigma factor (sigma-70 family)